MNTRRLTAGLILFAPLLWLMLLPSAGAEPLTAAAAVSETQVFAGESFRFQIQVSGSDNPDKPDISAITDFAVSELGHTKNNSQSFQWNSRGGITQNIKLGYVFSYSLTPTRQGNFVIPAITVHAQGRAARTEPVAVTVNKPAETDNFKLRMELSKTECYVGEPVTLTVTWYIGQDVNGFQFHLPALTNQAFAFADPTVATKPNTQYYRIPLGGKEIIGEKGSGMINGQEFATIIFRKMLIPRQAGEFTLEPAVVACEALVGYRTSKRPFDSMFGNDFLSDFFRDDFIGRRTGVYKNAATPSNELKLKVSELPLAGRPPGFAGHIGEYTIAANAAPQQVSVGDPITLKITLSGPEYLDHVGLPPLHEQQALARDFKIPTEMEDGKAENRTKTFTQTIRALRSDVKQIPAIELPYFDTSAGEYRVARAEPIPLQVKAAKIVTALDAEGRELPVAASRELEAWTRGIAHNYEDLRVLQHQRHGPEQWIKSPVWIAILTGSPLIYVFTLVGTVIARRRAADPPAARARKAYGHLLRALSNAQRDNAAQVYGVVLEAVRRYLGDKLRMTSASLTFADVKARLETKGIKTETLETLEQLFERCEAGQYAGNTEAADPGAVVEHASRLAKELERGIR